MNWIKKHKITIALIVIVFISAFLRFYKLDAVPALNADEAALGYNAYSLLKTGKDEHGHSWPLYFQSFNDYKPGLTVYLIMPAVYFFGLNELSVRVIPAFIGVITILIVYFLAQEFVKDNRFKEVKDTFPLISALVLAVSPWHIHFSRGAWEVNIATFFICVGVLCFLKIKHNPWLLSFSAIFFVLSLYTYHAARIVAPLLVFALAVLFLKDMLKSKKQVVVASIVGVVLCIPLLLSLKGPAGLARAGGVAIWSDSGPENRVNELRGDYLNMNGIIPKVLHNKPVGYTLAILQNWSEHFWGEFLFLSGDDIQRNKVPETGQMHLVEFVFICCGVYLLIKKYNKPSIFAFFWLLISPIPAAITFQAPHALRAESMVIPLVLIASFGFAKILSFVNTQQVIKPVKYLVTLIVCAVYCLSVLRYTHMYYVHMAKEYPFSSQYGIKELVSYVSPIHNEYKNVVITDRYDQPYILFLFYMKYDPESFQKDHELTGRDRYGFSTVRSFNNFKFESIPFKEDTIRYPNSLLIGTSEEILPQANVIQEIYGSNGYRYFKIVRN